MKTKTVFSTMLVMIVAALPAAQSQTAAKSKTKAVNYYPLKVGSKWDYSLDVGNGQKGTFSSVIAADEKSDGKSLFRLEVTVNGQKAPTTEHLSTDANGVYRAKLNGLELDPPLCILKYPIKANQTWTTKTKAVGQQLDVSCREGAEEDVQVPAGKFRAVPCTIETTQAGQKFVNTYWFAPDVGVVKQKIEIGGRVISLELTKYALNK